MHYLDLTLPSPEQNLALDEVLLELRDTGKMGDILRFWQPAQFFVVVGYANRVATEVNVEFCRQRGIGILRRCTGGGAVLQGPGCLNYSLVLGLETAAALQSIAGTNDYVLCRHAEVISGLLGKLVEKKGQTDLALDQHKFSGNAQRRRKQALLFHGSFLLGLDFEVIEQTLRLPSKQPEYRRNRAHRDFLANLNLPSDTISAALRHAWEADQDFNDHPFERVSTLVREKYGRTEWTFKF